MRRLLRQFISLTACAVLMAGCTAGRGEAIDPDEIQAQYGLSGAYVDTISTQSGSMEATIVPTTLSDGRNVQFVIPHGQLDPDHQVYMREGVTITPVELADPNMDREDFVQSQPRVVESQKPAASSEPAPSTEAESSGTRSTKDEVLIVGGSAGAGAAIGAVAGGKKGAAIGALSGGVAGLIYDLSTKDKK